MSNPQTQRALDEITKWAREFAAGGNPDGGENITFAIARQGSHTIANAFLTEGDCTQPFVPSGKRGTLHNQPPPELPPTAFFITGTHDVDQVPISMEADLNAGIVTLNGPFAEIPSTLEFKLEYLEHFTDDNGKNLAFYSKSDKPDDKAGYITVFCLIGAA
ncbi:hypothetical protein [Mycobacterium sp. E2327]|uniref:hypothetical protein n=1 Tax=Mycobacterium sp. E2327 TaxID=1834132 RepID=UPI000B2F9AF6|nr:hypothetical protein [Mycobacterium sp. E2327]